MRKGSGVDRVAILANAERLLAKGLYEQAIKEYLRLLQENKDDVATLSKVADLYVQINRSQESIPYFARIADRYARDGFFLKAIAIYKKINKLDPARLEVYDRLTDLYQKQGLVQDARSQYQIVAGRRSRSTVSSKGQVTVPKGVRQRYGLAPGTEVEFEFREDGALLRRKRSERHPVWDMIGSLRSGWPEGFPRDVDSYIDLIRGGPYEPAAGGGKMKKASKRK